MTPHYAGGSFNGATATSSSYYYWSAAATVAISSTAYIPQVFGKSITSSQSCRMASSTSSSLESSGVMTGYLNAADAAALDGELMSTPGFSLEQLMELAGLSVAEAVYQVVEEQQQQQQQLSEKKKPRILIVCGPGNNGGDGLVAARHLVMFGYECDIVYPKQSSKQHFINLVQQCQDVGISIATEMPSESINGYAAIVDAIFGFSFTGTPREPFASILQQIKQAKAAIAEDNNNNNNTLLTISVDVPSGWNVDEGDVANTGFSPDVLISLTTPKHCSKNFTGRHFVGGRFLPPKLAGKYGVQMPPYPGVSQVMEVTSADSAAKL